MSSSRRALAVVVSVMVGVTVLAGCSSGDGSSASGSDSGSSSGSAAPSATASVAPTPAPAPKVASCHRLTAQQAAAPTDETAAVPCRRPHTTLTVFVGRYDPVVDGHLLAVDSAAVQGQLARRCPKELDRYVGGDPTQRRLSRFAAVWFGPTVKQTETGARWFRCDLVALRAPDTLARLRGKLRGVLGSPAGLEQYGTCANAAPGARGFRHQQCTPKSKWRAVSTVDLNGKKYLGKAVQSDAESTCSSTAAARAGGALKYSSAFEWPSRQQWKQGERLGLCWVESTSGS